MLINKRGINNMKRYVVKMEFFVWADSDKEAIAIAESKAKKENEYNDNRANITEVSSNNFGSFVMNKIYPLIRG